MKDKEKLLADIQKRPKTGIGVYYSQLAEKYGISKAMVLYYSNPKRGGGKTSRPYKRTASKIQRVHVKDINVTSATEIMIGNVILKVPGNSITINGNEIKW